MGTIERDNITRYYCIRVYDIDKMIQKFEQRIFLEMDFSLRSSNFATFHGDERPMGLAFVSSEEANSFQEVISRLIKKYMNNSNAITMTTNGSVMPNLSQTNFVTVNNSVVPTSAYHSTKLRDAFKSIRKKVRIFPS